jgi:2-amino-4-hydroxy-6-hydroxymethyldihydropteridine diphosphokinase
MTKKQVYLSLGSNKGNRYELISKAITSISKIPGVELMKNSHVYETSPISPFPQEDFLNAACLIKTFLSPIDLLEKLQNIEHLLGQKKTEKEMLPRWIDIDMLFYDQLEFQDANLTLPHPRWHQRLFVLIPLLDITETLLLPSGVTFSLRKYIENFPKKNAQRVTLYTQKEFLCIKPK